MEFFYWQNIFVPLKCVVRFLTGTNIAFVNARWGYWAILVFCFFFAVTDVWWSLSTPSIFLVQRSPLRMPAGGTGLYWFFDWRNKMACAEAAIANLATEPSRLRCLPSPPALSQTDVAAVSFTFVGWEREPKPGRNRRGGKWGGRNHRAAARSNAEEKPPRIQPSAHAELRRSMSGAAERCGSLLRHRPDQSGSLTRSVERLGTAKQRQSPSRGQHRCPMTSQESARLLRCRLLVKDPDSSGQ